MLPREQIPIILLVSVLVFQVRAGAAISTTGDVVQVPAPVGSPVSVFQQISLFEESSGLLPATIAVDTIGIPLNWTEVADGVPGSIVVGTPYRSFYLFHGGDIGGNTATGTVTFDTDILGVIVSAPSPYWGGTNNLGASDPILGNPSTVYTSATYEGYEPIQDGFPDSFSISGDLRTLSINSTVLVRNDQVRVIVAAVPEPGTYLLLSAFIIVLFFFKKLRPKRIEM